MKALAPITIVCVCDNHYLMLLAALIKSVESNHVTNEKLQFYIVEDGVSEKNKRKLLNSINKETTELHWVQKSACIPSNLKLPLDTSSYPLNIYLRLFIPHFISEEISKVIYLDVDMIVQQDISLLWNTDLGDNIIAAVKDPWVQVVSHDWGGVRNYQELGLAGDTKYFNTGLLIIDIKKWLNLNVAEKVIDCINKNKEFAQFPDQYGLNVVLANKWLELDPLWNCFAYHDGPEPYLIHFTGRKPIYKSYNFKEEYKHVFFKYLHLTEWKDLQPIGETKRYIKKINNVLEKIKIFS